ncbi:hypothetical protein C4K24_5772 [Pseudomonas chlororaphis subsp. aurantiaca]|jgi:hypothetical protein|nr:hypothetical protein C4K24_5772 [Pseudomonas chlororaphis subsp. aurantiaca]
MALEAGDRFPVDRSLRQWLQRHKKTPLIARSGAFFIAA